MLRNGVMSNSKTSAIKLTCILCIVIACRSISAGSDAPFQLGDIVAKPGLAVSGSLTVPAGPDGSTKIPVTVIHGSKPGPVLALCAGIHGSEYAPVMALQRIRSAIHPEEVSGVIILVHVANPPSFFGRSVYYSPIDHRNPNTAFPGKPSGTMTERIAYTLTNEIVQRTDYLVDIHAGEANESLIPYVAYDAGAADAEVVRKSQAMAVAFGFPIIKKLGGRPRDPAASGSLSNTGVTRGKPTIGIESGELGEREGEAVSRIERGIWSLMRHLRMLEGQASPYDNPLYVENDLSIRSSVDGIFYPIVERGVLVNEGAVLGYVTDFFGQKLLDVRAPFHGVVLYLLAAPPVSKGEILVSIAQPIAGSSEYSRTLNDHEH